MSFVFVADGNCVPDKFCGAVVALGSFDGVHIGHVEVLSATVRCARALGVPAVVVTLEPHPRLLLQAGNAFFQLTTVQAKTELICKSGIDGVVALSFTDKLANMQPDEFVKKVLIGELNVKHVVVGNNFFFGRARSGSVALLKRLLDSFSIGLDVVSSVEMPRGMVVSSRRIRGALSVGEIELANSMLGYNWFVSAEVIHGNGRGASFGIPTANMMLSAGCGLAYGVYSVLFSSQGITEIGAAYFGTRPQFEENVLPMLEVHIIDSDRAVYQHLATVVFIEYLRPEMVFNSLGDFLARLREDIADSKRIGIAYLSKA